MTDVIVIGGGVIGLSIAWELAQRGIRVRLLEQGAIGREASWAGAGMLPPGNLAGAADAEARLRAASDALWGEWSQQLREETSIDNGYHRCGGLTVATSTNDRPYSEALSAWRAEGVAVEWIEPHLLRDRWPCLGESVRQGFILPKMSQVRNPRHLKSLIAACLKRGVELLPGQPVIAVNRDGEKIQSVRTPTEEYSAGEFVFAGGAWSSQLLGHAGIRFPVEPVRGQMVLLECCPLPFHMIIEQGKQYLVPRPDGKLLIGSTEERVGFVKANTAESVAELIRFGTALVPALKSANFVQAWSGLRPHRAGELPYLGRIDGLRNACVAAGHFRAGLQMSPITAVLIRQVILGERVQLPGECHQ